MSCGILASSSSRSSTDVTSRPSSNSVDSSSVSVAGRGAVRASGRRRRGGHQVRSIRTNYTGRSDGRADPAARLQRHRAHSAAPLPVSAGRSHHRAGAGQADRRHQERVARTSATCRTQPGERAGAAADDPDRVRRAGRRDPDSVEAREPRQADSLRRHRARAVPAAGLCRRRRGDRGAGEAAPQPHGRLRRLRPRQRPHRRERHDDVRPRPVAGASCSGMQGGET